MLKDWMVLSVDDWWGSNTNNLKEVKSSPSRWNIIICKIGIEN